MKFNSYKKVMLWIVSFILLTTILLYVHNKSTSLFQSQKIVMNGSLAPLVKNPYDPITNLRMEQKCDIFSGNWVPYQKGPYYTNTSSCVIDDRQNCMKFGRPDTEFMRWRWKPDECELPLFNAFQFLELMRGKSMAFVGDSLARNQMQSLVCLLATEANRIDVSYVDDTRFRRWLYPNYNFTLAAFWSTHLVHSLDADPSGYSLNSLMSLHLDKPDYAWAFHIQHFDYVIFSAGQWFSRPFMYYQNGGIIGCHACQRDNITALSKYYGYKMAFRTVFRTLLSLKNFKGTIILRTFSPPHFENGEWDKGGNCVRRRPFGKQEMKLDGYIMEFYLTQVEELRLAEREGRKKGLRFRLLDTTEAMLLRPDGHPNHYGHWPNQNVTVADCVHWCMPGPIDTWNEFLLQMLKIEATVKIH